MGKLKITVEMDEEEFYKYKKFKEAELIDIKTTGVINFLEAKGYVKKAFTEDEFNGIATASYESKSGKTTVFIRAEK